MKKSINKAHVRLGVLLLTVIVTLCLIPLENLFAEGKVNRRVQWEQLKTLPIQQGGRVMPLDSFSRILLLQLSAKSSLKVDSEKLSAVEWLAEALFDEAKAVQRPIFLIENPEIMEALQLPYKKARDRYTYEKLEPKINAIRRYAATAEQIKPEKRSLIQNQMLQLYNNLMRFEALIHTFSFWKNRSDLRFEGVQLNIKPGTNLSIADYIFLLYQRLGQIEQGASHERGEEVKINQCLKSLHETTVKSLYNGLFAIFHSGEKDKHHGWKYPWFVFYDLISENDPRHKQLSLFANIYRSYQEKNWEEVNKNLVKTHDTFVSMAKEKGEYRSIELEVKYNKYDLFYWSLILYVFATVFCCVSWLQSKNSKFFYMSALVCVVLAFSGHTIGMLLRMIIKARPPVSTLYESILFVSWVGVSMSFFLEYYAKKSKSLGLFVASLCGNILLFVANKYATEGDNFAVLVAVLDSNFWLATHVTTVTIGYSACLVAGLLGHAFIFLHLFSPGVIERYRKELTRMIYGSLCFAATVSFLGTILGGIWADQSWGRFWGWDPKENGAFLIVLWCIILLHARLGGYIREWGMALGCVFGNIIVAAAWWGVNLLSIGLHNYGFTSGLFGKLVIFTVVELAVILFGGILAYRHKTLKKKVAS